MTKSTQTGGFPAFFSSIEKEKDARRARANSHIITDKRSTESNGLGATKRRSQAASKGKVDGSITEHFPKTEREKPIKTFSKRRAQRLANTTMKDKVASDPEDDDALFAKRRKTDSLGPDGAKKSKLSDEDELSGFSDLEDNDVAATLEKIKKARERQDAVVVTRSTPDPVKIEPEEEEEEDWETIKARLRMAPTRNEMIAQQKEREDDGKNDIEFLPVGYNDAFTLDVREKKVRRQVNQHAEAQGWPFFTREGITKKIETNFQEIYDDHILPLLKKGGGEDNAFFKDITGYFASPAAQGASNSTLLMYLGSRKYTTGYYTELFAHQLNKHMTDTGIAQDFEDHVKSNKFLNDLILRSGLLFHFQTAICIPETVIRLIMNDRNVSYEEADQIRLRSAEFGIVVAEKIRSDERVDSSDSDSERDESSDGNESASEDESENESGCSESEDD